MRRFLTSMAVAGALVLSAPAIAAALPEMAISPAVLELTVAPGQAMTTEIVVQNPGTVSYRVSVYAWDMWHDGRERRYGPPGTFPQSLAQRLAASPGTFALAPGQKQGVQITIDVPADAKGGQYAVVFFEMAPAGDTGSSGQGPVLAISGRIGASVIVDTKTSGASLRVGKVEAVTIERHRHPPSSLRSGGRHEGPAPRRTLHVAVGAAAARPARCSRRILGWRAPDRAVHRAADRRIGRWQERDAGAPF
jgi:hypothetical protein